MQEAANTQPIWLIEEKIISFRVCLCITPLSDPTVMEIRLRDIIRLNSSVWHSIISGLIFCTTKSMNILVHDIFEIMLGSQAWKGATANFSLSAQTNRMAEIEGIWSLKEVLIKIIIEPRVWDKKYLIEFSPVFISVWKIINGMNAIVFNSRASHAVNKEVVDIIIIILVVIHKKYNRIEGEIIGEGVGTHRQGMSL